MAFVTNCYAYLNLFIFGKTLILSVAWSAISVRADQKPRSCRILLQMFVTYLLVLAVSCVIWSVRCLMSRSLLKKSPPLRVSYSGQVYWVLTLWNGTLPLHLHLFSSLWVPIAMALTSFAPSQELSFPLCTHFSYDCFVSPTSGWVRGCCTRKCELAVCRHRFAA